MSFLTDNLIPIFKKHELVFKESYQEAEAVQFIVGSGRECRTHHNPNYRESK